MDRHRGPRGAAPRGRLGNMTKRPRSPAPKGRRAGAASVFFVVVRWQGCRVAGFEERPRAEPERSAVVVHRRQPIP